MTSSGTLVIISCNESDPRIDPSRFFNLSTNITVVKTPGGRTPDAINALYSIDQSTRIGMIIVLQHTGCASSTGVVDTNVRDDIGVLKNSPYVRKEITVLGYVLDVGSSQLREVNVPRDGQDEESRRRVLSQMNDFGPFWN